MDTDAVVDMFADDEDAGAVGGHMDPVLVVAYDAAWPAAEVGHKTLLDKSVAGVEREDRRRSQTSYCVCSRSGRGIAGRAAFSNTLAAQALANRLRWNRYRLPLGEGLCDESDEPPSAAPLYENVRAGSSCLLTIRSAADSCEFFYALPDFDKDTRRVRCQGFRKDKARVEGQVRNRRVVRNCSDLHRG